MNRSMPNPVAEATAKALTAVQKAQAGSVAAGFELAGELLEQQRIATLALLEALSPANTTRKG